MKIHRPDFPLSYMESEKRHGHSHGRKKEHKQKQKTAPQLTVNALILLDRKSSSAPALPSADRNDIIDVNMIDITDAKEQ